MLWADTSGFPGSSVPWRSSALYSSIAMIVGLSLATYFWVRGFQAAQRSRSTLSAIPIGLFIAAIAGLKVTLIPYAGSYLLVLLFILLSRAETRQVGFRSVLPILASATALGLSWAALAWDTIERLLSMALQKFQRIVGRWIENVEETALAGNLDRFHGICANGSAGDGKDTYFHEIVTRGELLYGGHIFHYLGIVALIAVLTLLFMFFLYRRPKNQLLLLPAATMGLTCLLSVAGILIGVYGIHIDALVRYNAQVLVAVLPVLSLFCFAVFAGENKNLFKQAKTLATTAGVLLMLGVPVGAQAGLWVERTRVAMQERHNISYPLSQSSLRALDQLLSENVQNWAAGVQKKIPVGARVLSWVSVPFYFDFERNPIFTLAAPSRFEGISKISKPMRQAWLKKQLQDARVEYIVWEYKGSKKERGYKDKEALIQTLGGLAITERILYKNTNWVLIKLMGL